MKLVSSACLIHVYFASIVKVTTYIKLSLSDLEISLIEVVLLTPYLTFSVLAERVSSSLLESLLGNSQALEVKVDLVGVRVDQQILSMSTCQFMYRIDLWSAWANSPCFIVQISLVPSWPTVSLHVHVL